MPKYTVYKTTHMPTGRFYIGRHVTNDPHDKYLGSGVVIERMLNAHPASDFLKDVLEVFDTPEEMILAEERYIRAHWGSELLLNLVIGDPYFTGWLEVSQATRDKISAKHRGKKISDEHKAAISKAHLGKTRSDETKEKMRANHKGMTGKRHAAETIASYVALRSDGRCALENNGFFGKTHSEETKQRYSAHRKTLRWVSKDRTSKMVPESEVASMLVEGWVTGRGSRA